MKILLINFLDKRYGSTYRARHIFKCLKELGHSVKYIESNSPGGNDGATSVYQADSNTGYIYATLVRSFYCLFSKYDVLYLQKFILPAVPCIIIGKLRNKKVIVDWDDLDSDFQRTAFRKNLTTKIEFNYPKKVDSITVHNEYLKKFALSMGAANVFSVNQIVNTEIFDPSKYIQEEEKGKLGLKGKILAGFLCTLTHGGAGDLDLVAEAVKMARKRYSDLFFLVIGGGPLENEFAKAFDEAGLKNYLITGLVLQDDVPKHLAACDFCLIYMRETAGNKMRMSFKVLEYLSMNKKVVGHVVGETKDKLEKYIVVSGAKAQDFSDKICSVIEKKEYLSNNNSRDYIIQNHSIEIMKKQLSEVLK
ncbi:MAG: glycosyltransferase [Elusimicrobia bacterium]|nr:glycosyltransferase [Elusimicrobiota bacterium]MBU2615167.1 glycosyltransferase [Elusimicrobiota bacterium]